MNIEQLRKDTPHCNDLTHFNNAGAALPSKFVNESILEFLEAESRIGGYEIVEERAKQIGEFYTEAAALIKASPDEIAITDSASTAFSKAIFSIPFKLGDKIITSELEYGNNFLNYLKLKKEKGIEIITIRGNEASPISIEELKNAIDSKVKLIAITHMPTSSGVIAPVKEIGKIAKENGILYLVDTCQSIGQFPVYVDELQCDFLNATSRKYLRGPRGLGFLYVRKRILASLDPFSFEMLGAEWKSQERYDLNYSSKMFETYEKPYAFLIGFSAAIKYANQLGIENIWQRISYLSNYLREQLGNVSGVKLYDGSGLRSGIISFTKDGVDPFKMHKELQDKKINSSVLYQFTSLLEMQKKNLVNGNRLSLHCYNTKTEINKVVSEIDKM